MSARTLPFALALAATIVLAPASAGAAERTGANVTRARWLMGTLWTFTATAAPADSAATGRALDAALDSVAALERSLSNWSPTSELSRLNAAGTRDTVSQALAAVLDSALALAAETGGAFDPTVEPLTVAWDLRGAGRVPDPGAIAAARARVGYARVSIAHHGPRSTAAVDLGGGALDLGGIGKGYALDHAAALLAARGVRGFVLDAGGQRLADANGAAWVAHPLDRDRPAVRVRAPRGSLSTSVQRERELVVRGRRVGHVLDPRTGEPAPAMASVTVAAPSGTRADALSTALLVLGRDAARDWAVAHPAIGVLWIEPRGRAAVVHAWNLEVLELAPDVRNAPVADRTTRP